MLGKLDPARQREPQRSPLLRFSTDTICDFVQYAAACRELLKKGRRPTFNAPYSGSGAKAGMIGLQKQTLRSDANSIHFLHVRRASGEFSSFSR
jgi:hypothetical protein